MTEVEKTVDKKSGVLTKIYWIIVGVLAVILISIIIANICGCYIVVVQGSSMNDTLINGDRIIALKGNNITYGNIVVINRDTEDSEEYLLIKRVIGLAGDTIEIKDGAVYRNGEKLEESYAKGITETTSSEYLWTIGEGEFFFLGDNRSVSRDSRYYGVYKIANVQGVVVGWSLNMRWLNNFILGFVNP